MGVFDGNTTLFYSFILLIH